MIQDLNKLQFLSTPSGWRATDRHTVRALLAFISIHALRVEGDEQFPEYEDLALLISIHALRVEGDRNQRSHQCKRRDFYPRPPGGGRHNGQILLNNWDISIHALRVEGDMPARKLRQETEISIHALRVEGDRTDRPQAPRKVEFLSTPSGWRATAIRGFKADGRGYFYPRPPGGGRLGFHRDVRKAVEFLSTPSGWRATSVPLVLTAVHVEFLSTPSGWRATGADKVVPCVSVISIHALRVEGDSRRS